MLVIVGITTIPERLEKGLLEKAIKTLLAQTRVPDAIVVNVPETSKKGVVYDKAKAMALKQLSPIVHVNYGGPDPGPIAKLLKTLRFIDHYYPAEKGLDPWIMLADDDTSYPSHLIQSLIDGKQPEDRAVGFVGRSSGFLWLHLHIKDRMENVTFLETYAGVLYKRDTFGRTDDFVQWLGTLPPESMFVDDIVIGAWMNMRGTSMTIIPALKDQVSHDAQGTLQLNEANNFGGRNRAVFRSLQSLGYFPETVPRGFFEEFVHTSIDRVWPIVGQIAKAVTF
jgi:hypothetical protein